MSALIIKKYKRKEETAMRPGELKIDFETLIPLKTPAGYNQGMRLNVTKGGNITINKDLVNVFRPENDAKMQLSIQLTKDYKIVVLKQIDVKGFSFNYANSIKHKEFAMELEAKGYILPVRYQVEWNEDAAAWVGIMEEVECAPSINEIAKSVARGRKRGAGKQVK